MLFCQTATDIFTIKTKIRGKKTTIDNDFHKRPSSTIDKGFFFVYFGRCLYLMNNTVCGGESGYKGRLAEKEYRER